jgi:hypothetical protein
LVSKLFVDAAVDNGGRLVCQKVLLRLQIRSISISITDEDERKWGLQSAKFKSIGFADESALRSRWQLCTLAENSKI